MRKIFYSFWIVLFFVGIIVPLFHMNTVEITEQENRTLAKFPETKKNNQPNYGFGKEFESWVGDRFWGRDSLINARFQTMYKINGRVENDKAFVGDDGWMFMKDGIVNVPSLEKQREKIVKDAAILKRFDDKFKGKNIPIYLVLIPDRNQLYQKYWEKYYTPKPRLDYGDELIKLLKDHPNIHVIYPKKEFIRNKDEQLYRKLDHHLNYIGEDILIKNAWQNMTKSKGVLYRTEIFTSSSGSIKRELLLQSDIKDTGLLVPRDISIDYVEEKDPDTDSGYSHIYRYSYNTKSQSKKYLHIWGPCYVGRFFYALGTYFKEVEQVYSNTSSIFGRKKTQEILKKIYDTADKNDVILLMIDPEWTGVDWLRQLMRL